MDENRDYFCTGCGTKLVKTVCEGYYDRFTGILCTYTHVKCPNKRFFSGGRHCEYNIGEHVPRCA